MRRGEASQTALWVAAARSVGSLFPDELVLAQDPYGVRFARGPIRALADALLAHPRVAERVLMHSGPLTSFLLWMQLRTRALDDVLLDFVQRGGRQVLLLGAGYDCRALRFARELEGAVVFEVDHPATQARKLAQVGDTELRGAVVYTAWDFTRDAIGGLPARLHADGLDATRPVLTIWEGVTMYLEPRAIEQTVEAVRVLGAPGSELAFTYIDRRAIYAPRGDAKLTARLVARVGEPYRFGFDPAGLGSWLAARGMSLSADATDAQLAARFFPKRVWPHFKRENRHLAVAHTL